MLLTIFGYLIYRELRDINTEPETNDEILEWVLKGIAVILFWPYFLARLEKYQETDGQRTRLIVTICVVAILSVAFGFYLIIGALIAVTRATAYLYTVYKIQQSKE